ncbi:MAG: hypothetical protein JO086_08460, partial [Acidimicrobiia bacterium]|nr:hypothetical protein [Acidimicrobiia bacterium]
MRTRLALVALAMVLVASACGARLTGQELAQASRHGGSAVRAGSASDVQAADQAAADTGGATGAGAAGGGGGITAGGSQSKSGGGSSGQAAA